MDIFHAHYTHLKDDAALLLKHAQHPGPLQEKALERFRQLDSFGVQASADTKASKELKLKHALNVVAVENCYESWSELKLALDTAAATSPLAEIGEQFYPKHHDAYSNNWFADYRKARQVLTVGGGFLFPYKNHFFICEAGFVEGLGLSPSLPEWKAISWDWIHPSNVKAWLKLNELYAAVIKR